MQKADITGRELRHGSPEEDLLPGEFIRVQKRGGKVFELKRVDSGRKDITEAIDLLFKEMPAVGEPFKINAAKIIMEDRE